MAYQSVPHSVKMRLLRLDQPQCLRLARVYSIRQEVDYILDLRGDSEDLFLAMRAFAQTEDNKEFDWILVTPDVTDGDERIWDSEGTLYKICFE